MKATSEVLRWINFSTAESPTYSSQLIRTFFFIIMLSAHGAIHAQKNVAPEITGQVALSTPQDTPIEILFEHLQVTDPDNTYPQDFTMQLKNGKNYTLSGTTVIPDAGFSGNLTVQVSVDDGKDSSPAFDLSIEVTPVTPPPNVAPNITGQVALSTTEGQAVTINFADLVVEDPDDTYPTGFSMNLQAGTGYSVSGQTVTPDAGFTGSLSVPVTVNDGTDDSAPFTLSITVEAAPPVNVKPVITGQVALSTIEETAITIQFSDLTVNDPDDTYPNGFSMTLSPGSNYTVNGQVITPVAGFTGSLTIPVTVNDGEASSDPFDMKVTVTESVPPNVKPVITGQATLTTEEGKAIGIRLEDLTVTDPDNDYPKDFTLVISPGNNYTVSGRNVTPAAGFTGQLQVPVTVNDGEATSDPFTLVITVTPKPVQNVKPNIIGQATISILNTESVTITFNHLFVTDPDDSYPTGFTLKLYPGSNYTLNGNTVTPPADFTGTLTVKVTVNDGQDESKPFDLKITVVAPVTNIKPVITGQQELTTFRDTPLTLRLTHLIVSDPDDPYPGSFTMEILAGDNYTSTGSTITPASGFTGSLSVGARVNDGTIWSEPFILTITVVEKNELRITGQDEIIIKEDSLLTINLSHLEVNDPSGKYPAGFSIIISSGDNYTFSGSNIIPDPDFAGTLEVSVQVRDGAAASNVFGMIVLVIPVNDPPVFTTFNGDMVSYAVGAGELAIASEVVVDDPDHDQLVFAEVFIDREQFVAEKDILSATSSGNIRTLFDPNTGILALLGVASLEEYQNAIRSVQYTYANDTLPDQNLRTIHFRLNDGQDFSALYTKTLQIGEIIELDIPNVFSPNDDLANDKWIISRQSLSDNASVTIRVFDKRGSIVYESKSLDNPWDGRFKGQNLPSDTYFYTIVINNHANSITRQGVVTILR
jgi:gliding motility-associated-like protein